MLVTEPDLLVLDEPTRGVDPERKLELASLLRAQATGRATLVVTHDLVFAADVADRVVSARPEREACMSRALLLAAAVVTFAGGAWAALDAGRRGALAPAGRVRAVASGFAWLESGPGSAKEVALVAVLGGVAAAGRVLFTAVPGVQPVTVVAVAAGAALGARVGFARRRGRRAGLELLPRPGDLDAWQMLAWGGCGVVGALAARLIRRRWAFAALCFALGFAFSSAMDLWHWYSFWPHTWEALTVVYARGVWFSAAHAVGNVIFALAIGPELRRLLERYGRRLRTEVAWA